VNVKASKVLLPAILVELLREAKNIVTILLAVSRSTSNAADLYSWSYQQVETSTSCAWWSQAMTDSCRIF
jgi:hypothetical protein